MIDENVVEKKSGVDAYGISIDYVRVDKSGHLVTQERMFLAGNMVCTYSRERGMKRASWEAQTYPSHDQAREAVLAKVAFDGQHAVMSAEPVVVELTATDIQQINNGEPPHSRHAGVVAIEKKAGKVDDDGEWDLPMGLWKTVKDDE